MGDFLTPEQIAESLGLTPKTVRDWLRSGDLVGIKVGKSWRVHPTDMDRLLGEQLFRARLERAKRVHPDTEWKRGQCPECGTPMPEPIQVAHWVCSPKCKAAWDRKAAIVLGGDSEEFVVSCGEVVPQY